MILILIFTASSFAQDWPQWRGINRDGDVSGFKAPSVWPTELQPEWKVTVGFGDAGPVIVGNKLYVYTRQGEDEVLFCLDTSTGKLLWRKENPSGQVPKFFTAMSPIIFDGRCVAYLGGNDEGTITAWDLNSGNEKWKWTGEGPTYSSPEMMTVDGKKQLVFITSKRMIGLNAADGKLLWQIDAPSQNRFYNAATPVISGQTVFLNGLDSGTKAFKMVKQGNDFVSEELWNNPDLGTKYNTPVIQGGFMYGLSNGRKFYCLDVAKGQTMWTDTLMNSDFGATVNCGSAIMALPSNSNLIFFKPTDKAYSELMRIKISDKPVFATPVIQGNKIYIKDAESLAFYRF